MDNPYDLSLFNTGQLLQGGERVEIPSRSGNPPDTGTVVAVAADGRVLVDLDEVIYRDGLPVTSRLVDRALLRPLQTAGDLEPVA